MHAKTLGHDLLDRHARGGQAAVKDPGTTICISRLTGAARASAAPCTRAPMKITGPCDEIKPHDRQRPASSCPTRFRRTMPATVSPARTLRLAALTAFTWPTVPPQDSRAESGNQDAQRIGRHDLGARPFRPGRVPPAASAAISLRVLGWRGRRKIIVRVAPVRRYTPCLHHADPVRANARARLVKRRGLMNRSACPCRAFLDRPQFQDLAPESSRRARGRFVCQQSSIGGHCGQRPMANHITAARCPPDSWCGRGRQRHSGRDADLVQAVPPTARLRAARAKTAGGAASGFR